MDVTMFGLQNCGQEREAERFRLRELEAHLARDWPELPEDY